MNAKSVKLPCFLAHAVLKRDEGLLYKITELPRPSDLQPSLIANRRRLHATQFLTNSFMNFFSLFFARFVGLVQ